MIEYLNSFEGKPRCSRYLNDRAAFGLWIDSANDRARSVTDHGEEGDRGWTQVARA